MLNCPHPTNYDFAGFINDVLMNIFTGIIIILALIPLYLSSNFYKNRKIRKRASKLIFDIFCQAQSFSSWPTLIEYRSHLPYLSEEDLLVYSLLKKCRWINYQNSSLIKESSDNQFAQFSFKMSNDFYKEKRIIYIRYPDKKERQRRREYKKLSKDLSGRNYFK